ncbi:hypothetical protein [Capillimicrobium parvum]|uniref:Uncharacterized protein n=1 Tax=Capillimicrobium parvum TaxID=2884022 RepID=A0A9E6XSU9_9ACTN|nr:hypothetical protein [Capillimicrobium parvum]UGS34038.1 hypothetical protein DSM104329_00409 [Capillimicrobium parvum]
MSPPSPDQRPPHAIPWQFLIRAVMVVTGLTLLLVAKVHGAAFYVAWALIGLALLSEAAAMLVYRVRMRGARRRR